MKTIVATPLAILAISLAAHAQTLPSLDIQREANNGVELRWRASSNLTPGKLPTFQLESSDDFLQWSPVGPAIRAASVDELHLRSFANDRARAFYRLLARYDSIAKASLASGGAEVFGYGVAFATELAKLGQITPDQFAAKYPFPNNYLDHVSFDVAQARFFADFDADPAVVNATRIPDLEPFRETDFRLNADELAIFKKNGFVVSESQAMPSFADQFYRIWKDDMPVYVSTDAILHAWHRTYDAIMEELEENWARQWC